MNKEIMLKDKIKKIIQFILNPRLLLCVGLAWVITNGWSYVLFVVGTYFQVGWMIAIASGYLAFLWLPISPEKLATAAIAMLLLRLLFPNDTKTLAIVKGWYNKFKNRLKKKEDAQMLKNHKKKLLIWIIVIVAFLAIIIGGCAIYLNDYYHADADAIAQFTEDSRFSPQKLDDGSIVYAPEDAMTGFIFYPGGKVEHTAYVPLMEALAEKGILCVLVEMPFRLAVLDMTAADGIPEMYPQIENWYIGGHSLGGSMAASYLAKHTDTYDGLILLGAYSTADLSDSSLNVLSVYGSEDKILNLEKYVKNQPNLPDHFIEAIIDGGCHSYFGMYGAQNGDGTPTISNEEQIYQTVDAILELLQ